MCMFFPIAVSRAHTVRRYSPRRSSVCVSLGCFPQVHRKHARRRAASPTRCERQASLASNETSDALPGRCSFLPQQLLSASVISAAVRPSTTYSSRQTTAMLLALRLRTTLGYSKPRTDPKTSNKRCTMLLSEVVCTRTPLSNSLGCGRSPIISYGRSLPRGAFTLAKRSLRKISGPGAALCVFEAFGQRTGEPYRHLRESVTNLS